MSRSTQIPLIELERFRRGSAGDKRALAAEVDRACREIGFLSVAAHGVARATISAAREASLEFFSLSDARKTSVARPAPGVMRGWLPIGHESLSRSLDRTAPPDLNESFQIGPPSAPDNLWPSEPVSFEKAWTRYYRAMERLGGDLMRVFAASLSLPPSYFDHKFDRHISRLRARHYPPLAARTRRGQLRAGAHTDYVSLAILATDPRTPGLQIEGPNGRWLDVPLEPDVFVVNVGDLLARWTNDRWKSTLHRVANPPAEQRDRARLSLVFFHCPNERTLIRCLDVCCRDRPARYQPVTAGEWLRTKFAKAEL